MSSTSVLRVARVVTLELGDLPVGKQTTDLQDAAALDELAVEPAAGNFRLPKDVQRGDNGGARRIACSVLDVQINEPDALFGAYGAEESVDRGSIGVGDVEMGTGRLSTCCPV
ncbi:uncharacterized protein BO97DRAFT_440201 [Aspergillus homomorphus CBS 101889]|uniref:Uncharacterized protein n=1 Tax=Aspergillus homomorphus (strain CBS 101889) TaxID=1450537 RepID=A0A395I8F0_ASPHC|nr:hypothetical protein BO97DRAFT_440201 [Aspergillus homomorphus CBS 101889]RAL16427.1 hypothetical protein BO97DRAFT_440201 [Aspergillus homomorphus CBS 101889]